MRLDWSDQALFDLDIMYQEVFEACKDFDTTDNYYDGMVTAVEAKLPFPRSGAKLFIGDIWTREYFVVYKEYAAFYCVEGEVMKVLRVEMTRQDHVKRFIRGRDY